MRAREREREREITCVCAFVSCPFVCVRIFWSERKRQRETERDEREGEFYFILKLLRFPHKTSWRRHDAKRKGPHGLLIYPWTFSLSLFRKSRANEESKRKKEWQINSNRDDERPVARERSRKN